MQVYLYQAALYCESCGRMIREQLAQEGKAPPDPSDEATFDSGSFPKGPFYPRASDLVEHCAAAEGCGEAIELSGRSGKVGAWLENALTPVGVRRLQETIKTGYRKPLVKLWRRWYGTELAEVRP